MNNITKYLLIGLLLGITLMLLINAGGAEPVERYKMYFIRDEGMRGITFYILDTQKGVAKKFYGEDIVKFNN